MAAVAFQHIGLQQCVVFYAVKHNVVVGQHMLVVLEVLPDFFDVGIFKQGFDSCQRAVKRQLLRRTGVVVHQRQISRYARHD